MSTAKILEKLAQMEARVTQLDQRVTEAAQIRTGAVPGGAPGIRRGENHLTSRGFKFQKLFSMMRGWTPREDCVPEMKVHDLIQKTHVKIAGGYKPENLNYGFMAPLSTALMPDADSNAADYREMKDMIGAGIAGADADEIRWLRRKMYGIQGKANQSWLTGGLGEDLVAPAEQGEVIELLRNTEVFMNAGARVVPLPAQGRMIYPAQTSATTGYWVGENSPVTASTFGTGTVSLTARKVAILVSCPNDLLRYASGAAEMILREDIARSIALTVDLALLEGLGGTVRPLGLINYPNINTFTSSTTGTNGDTLVGGDLYKMIEAVEEANVDFETWVMRPKTLNNYFAMRGDAVTGGDAAGQFLFAQMRNPGDGFPPQLAGYPVVKSTQVSRTRVKGSGTNLTYTLGGKFSDYLMGLYGAMEYAQATQGDTAFANDQTVIRGIMIADGVPRHEASFVFCDNLLTT